MKTFLKILLGIVVVIVVAVGAAMFFTSGERETARQFVLQATNGNAAEAHGLMHDALQDQIPVDQLTEMFAGARPYTEVSFSGFEKGGGRTTLSGTASTADGCTSTADFELLGGQIISFDITPLCR
jgi:hypothetical protein